MAITKIDRATHRLIAEHIAATLKDLGDTHGINFTSGGGVYSNGGTGSFKIEAEVRDVGTGVSGAEAQFRASVGIYGIDPDCFGKTFVSGKHTFTIAGYRPSARVNCIEANSSWDGKSYVFPPDAIRKHYPYPVKSAA